jgi:uroporphyrinogen III methyltransferase / synthase
MPLIGKELLVYDDVWSVHRGFGGPPAAKGTVHLVGAGPGDVSLLTLRAATLLSSCDVVAYDRLAPVAALDLVPDHAEQICVGKRSGEMGMSRAGVDELLRSRARAGAAVVRLKGGDPFVFGRGGEEAEACAAAGVPVEIVHGITAPVAVPGAAGIPVTHRTVAAGFAVVTGHEDPRKPGRQIDLARVATFPGTLLFLMAVDNLADLCRELQRHGRASDTPIALVQWGTTAHQLTVTGTLDTIVDAVAEAGIGSPSVVVVGDVVSLAGGIAYREARPLHGVPVLVPRTLDRPSRVAASLRAMGADVREVRVARTEAVDVAGAREVVAGLLAGRIREVAVTSTLAVELLRDALRAEGSDARGLAGATVWAVGRSVAATVRETLAVDPDEVVSSIDDLPVRATLAVLRRDDEPWSGVSVAATRTVPLVPDGPPRWGRPPVVAVGSSAVVAHLDGWADREQPHVSMGPTTTRALLAAGRRVVGEADEPTAVALSEALARIAATRTDLQATTRSGQTGHDLSSVPRTT